MTIEQLREEIEVEMDCLRSLVQEISSLQQDLAGREPTVREKTAAGAFLAQFTMFYINSDVKCVY